MKPIPPRLLITIYSSLFAAFHRIRECAHNRGATPRWRTPWPRSSGWSCGGRDLRVSLVSIPSYETDRGYFIASGVRHSGQRSRRRAEPCRRTCFSMLPLSASLLPWDVLLCRSGGCRREYHDRGDGDHLNGERFLACTFPGANFHHREHLVTTVYLLWTFPQRDWRGLLPDLIRRYNESQGGVNNDTTGYHETITLFYLDLIGRFLALNRNLDLVQTCSRC
jgi:hypothetical protein